MYARRNPETRTHEFHMHIISQKKEGKKENEGEAERISGKSFEFKIFVAPMFGPWLFWVAWLVG